MSVSFVKAAFADKPTLMRRWFFARVFNANAQANPNAATQPTQSCKTDRRPPRPAGRRKLGKAA